jgi:hypothetical protein
MPSRHLEEETAESKEEDATSDLFLKHPDVTLAICV